MNSPLYPAPSKGILIAGIVLVIIAAIYITCGILYRLLKSEKALVILFFSMIVIAIPMFILMGICYAISQNRTHHVKAGDTIIVH